MSKAIANVDFSSDRRISLFESIKTQQLEYLESIGGETIRVTFQDGTVKEGKKWQSNPFDIAKEKAKEASKSAGAIEASKSAGAIAAIQRKFEVKLESQNQETARNKAERDAFKAEVDRIKAELDALKAEAEARAQS